MGRTKRERVTPERVLREMADIAFASFYDFATVEEVARDDGTPAREVRLVPTARVPPEKRAALASIKQSQSGFEIKLCDKWRALEALARITGLYGDGAGGEEAVKIVDDV